VTVEWNSRLRTTAGLACWRTNTISLNPKLIEVSPSEVQRTLRHELAHFLAQHRAGRRQILPHGVEWRLACSDLGIPNESRCHDLPLKRIRFERRYFYACRECGTTLARVHAMKRHVACLKCCRRHNEGKYHERFRFIAVPAPERLAA
jgi:predicted SprT family Zn-dependent metalloprotease